MPDTDKEKNLRACTKCKLVMSMTQWDKKACVNCGEDVYTTAYFSGLISVFMPSNSWVAKFNDL